MRGFERIGGVLIMVAFAGGAAGGGCGPGGLRIKPSTISVTGTVRGVDGVGQPAPDFVLTLGHGSAATPRTSFARSPGIQDVRSIRLVAPSTTGLPFSEEWHFLHLSHVAQRPGAEPVFIDFAVDKSFVRDHVGDLAWLTLRQREATVPLQVFDRFPAGAPRAGGATVLARVEDDDPVLPWTSTAACGPLARLALSATLRQLGSGGVDCFDMQSLSSMILNQLAVLVAGAAHDRQARVTGHRLAIIPHLTTPTQSGAPALPGFGFIYQTDLVSNLDRGGFTGTLTLSVPLTIVWSRSVTPPRTLNTAVDPIDASSPRIDVRLQNLGRITVTAPDDSIASAFAETLRTSVITALGAASFTGPAGLPITSLLDTALMNSVLANRDLPADFSVVALPSDRRVQGAPRNIALRMGEVAIKDVPAIIPIPGGLGARTVLTSAAGVSVTINLNAAGSLVRRFDLPAVQEPLPFDLVVLR